MITFLTIVYVFVCVFLILVVLLQAGRGGGMGAAFGGSSQTVFGGAGAGNFLTRLTVVMAAMFMLLSATLAYLSSGSDKALEKAAQAVQAREEARKLPADKKKGGTAGAAPASGLTSDPSATPEAEGAPVEGAPVEGAPPAVDPHAAPQGALEAVDDALQGAEGTAPAPSEPAPAAPAAPAKPVGEGAPAAPSTP
jgi:preprotein translocase subunit SecG